MAVTPPVVTSERVEQKKSYIKANRGTCSKCGLPFFWASTPNGKRVPIDFPDSALHPNKTHKLVMGSKDGVWDGTLEAWPHDGPSATHTVHFDTCKKRNAA